MAQLNPQNRHTQPELFNLVNNSLFILSEAAAPQKLCAGMWPGRVASAELPPGRS
jgi:hypothetical protein